MHNSYNEQYQLLEAWNLFTKNGINKTEILSNFEIKVWNQSKLLGVDPFLDFIDIKAKIKCYQGNYLSQKIRDWAFNESFHVYVFNNDKILLDECGIPIENFKIEIGGYLNENLIGINALYLSIKSGKFSIVKGAQHYCKALHYYTFRAYPIILNGIDYYICFLNHFSENNSVNDENINRIVEGFFNDKEQKENNNLNEYSNFSSSIYNISMSGKLDEISPSSLDYIDIKENISSIFPSIEVFELFEGKKQIVKHKNTGKYYLISPISRDKNEILNVYIENIDELSDLFVKFFDSLNSLHNFKPLINKLSLNDYRRLNAGVSSVYPLIVICNKLSDQIMVSMYISSVLEKKYNIKFNFDNLEEKILEFLKVYNSIKPISNSYKQVCFHIYNVSKLLDNELEEFSSFLLSSSSQREKFLLYLTESEYENLKMNNNEIFSLFKLNVFYASESFLYQIKESYNQNCSDNIQIEDKIIENEKDNIYSLKWVEKKAIIDALILSDYNLSKACKILDISRATIYRKIKEYSIEIKSF